MIKYYVFLIFLGIGVVASPPQGQALNPNLPGKAMSVVPPPSSLEHLKSSVLSQKTLDPSRSHKKMRTTSHFSSKGHKSQAAIEVIPSTPDHLNPPFLTNLSYLPVKKYEVGSMVSAVSIRSRSLLGELSTDFKAALLGGKLTGYSEMMRLAFKDAEDQLRVEARLQGATHVIGVQMTSGMTLSNDIWVRAQGTAVRVTDSTPVPVFMENPAKLEILQTPPPEKVDDAIIGLTPQEEKLNILEKLTYLH